MPVAPYDTTGDGVADALTVGGGVWRSQVTLTRPNDTTAYAVNDAITDSTSASTSLNFAGVARSAGAGTILGQARLTVNKTGLTNSYRLWLYRDVPASIPNDNAAFSQTYANSSLRIGYVDFATALSGSDCTDYYGTPVYSGAVPIVPVGTALRGLLQTLTAHTPDAQQQYMVVLMGYFE